MTDTLGFHNFRHTQSPKLLFVDSRDAHHSRLDGKAEFTYVFNQAIHNNEGEGVLVSLLQARAGSNDSIKITAVKSGASADYTITVPAGNYTVTSLAQKLSSMDSQTGGLSQILAKVPILDKPGSVITHEPANAVYKALIQTEAVRAITLRLTDDRNSLISLNGCPQLRQNLIQCASEDDLFCISKYKE
eukprot:SAG22_NODE_163_length_16829_cov_9.946204_3_plen_189_part_00